MLTFLIFQIQKAATKSRVFGTMEVLEMSRYHPGRALFSVLHLMLAMLTDLRSIFPVCRFFTSSSSALANRSFFWAHVSHTFSLSALHGSLHRCSSESCTLRNFQADSTLPSVKEPSKLHNRVWTEIISSLESWAFVLVAGSLTPLPECHAFALSPHHGRPLGFTVL